MRTTGVYDPSIGPTGTPYQGFWIRLVAYIIDYIVLILLLGLFFAILDFILPIEALDVLLPEEDSLIYYLYGGVGFAIYDTFMIGRFGATVGKWIVGIEVLYVNGSRISYWRAFGRYLATYLSGLFFGIGYLMAAFRQNKRAMHDDIADTVVVRRQRRPF